MTIGVIYMQAAAAAAEAVSADPAISGASAAVPGAAADAESAVAAAERPNGASADGDVYFAEDTAGPGVWDVENVLDAEYDTTGGASAYEPHTLSIEVRGTCYKAAFLHAPIRL